MTNIEKIKEYCKSHKRIDRLAFRGFSFYHALIEMKDDLDISFIYHQIDDSISDILLCVDAFDGPIEEDYLREIIQIIDDIKKIAKGDE